MRYILFLFLACTACRMQSDKVNEYNSYIHSGKNGLKIVKTDGPLTCRIQYEPKEFCALKEVVDVSKLGEQYHLALNNYSELVYFNFQCVIDTTGLKLTSDSASDILNELRFYMESKFKLLSSSDDSLPCLIAHAIIGGDDKTIKVNTVMGFSRKESWNKEINENIKVVFLNPFGKEINLEFREESFKSIPELKI